MSKTLVLQPRLSEKAYNQSTAENVYVFEVSTEANKMQVKEAVEAQYKVKVADVRTVIAKGKTKQTNLRGRRPVAGRRSDVKKAYVKLMPGNSISIFEDIS